MHLDMGPGEVESWKKEFGTKKKPKQIDTQEGSQTMDRVISRGKKNTAEEKPFSLEDEKVLEEKIKKQIKKEAKALKGTTEKDWNVAPSTPEPLVLKELNETQIADLRESIRKAQESENDATLEWYGGNFDKAGEDKKEAEKIKKELMQSATDLENDSTLSWYGGDFDNAKQEHDTARMIEKELGITTALKNKSEVLVEKYGTHVIAMVREMYDRERSRLVKMGYRDNVLKAALVRFKKNTLEPILVKNNLETQKKNTSAQPDKQKQITTPEEPKKKWWDKFNSFLRNSRYGK